MGLKNLILKNQKEKSKNKEVAKEKVSREEISKEEEEAALRLFDYVNEELQYCINSMKFDITRVKKKYIKDIYIYNDDGKKVNISQEELIDLKYEIVDRPISYQFILNKKFYNDIIPIVIDINIDYNKFLKKLKKTRK